MPPTLFRSLGSLGLGKQTVQGTGVAPTKFPKLSKSAFIPVPKVTDYRNGNNRDFAFSTKDEFAYKGAFETFMYADEATALLAYIMGKDTVTGAGDPWTHTLDLTVDALPYLSAQAQYYENQIIDRVIDTKLIKLALAADVGKPAMLTGDLLGGSVLAGGSPAVVSFTDGAGEGPMMFYHQTITLTGPSDFATIQGQIQKISLDIDQGGNAEYGPGQVYPIAVFEQGRIVTLKLQTLFSGPAWHNLINYGGSAGTTVSQVVTTGTFETKFTSQAAPERSIDLNCPLLHWHLDNPQMMPDGKSGLFDVTAIGYRSGATLPLTVIGKNGVATPYV
jgi:hypothetical protein